jgi:hypothetical protein
MFSDSSTNTKRRQRAQQQQQQQQQPPTAEKHVKQQQQQQQQLAIVSEVLGTSSASKQQLLQRQSSSKRQQQQQQPPPFTSSQLGPLVGRAKELLEAARLEPWWLSGTGSSRQGWVFDAEAWMCLLQDVELLLVRYSLSCHVSYVLCDRPALQLLSRTRLLFFLIAAAAPDC